MTFISCRGRATVIVLSGLCTVCVARADAPSLPPAPSPAPAIAELSREDPAALIAQGDEFYHKNQLQEAHECYLRAAQIDPKNVQALIKDGEVLHDMAQLDPKFQGQDRSQWFRAVQADSSNIDALQHLLGADIDAVKRQPRGELFVELGDVARKILTLKPDDARAKAYDHIAAIGGWMATGGVQATEEQIDGHIAALRDLMKSDPANAEIPYAIARAYLYRATVQQKADNADAAKALIAQALAVFDDAVAAQPKNVPLLFRYAQTLSGLESLDRPTYSARVREVLAQARQAVAPTDPLLVEVYVSSAQFEAQHGDAAASEKILRDLYKLVPNDQRVRLALAETLSRDPAKQPEAIALLRLPIAAAGPANSTTNLQIQTWLSLANLLMDAIPAADPKNRPALLKEAHDVFANVPAEAASFSLVLKTRGKLELMDGGPTSVVTAIQTLEQARRAAEQASPGSQDYELMFLLARAYYVGGQTGPAKTLLIKVVQGVPTFVPARILLTQLFLADNQTDLAKDNLVQLQAQAPKNPDVTRLNLAYLVALDPSRHDEVLHQEAVNDLYPQLPEDDHAQKLQKAQVAASLGLTDDAIRLLKLARTETPTDPRVIAMLAQIYINTGKKDDAIAVVAAAAAKDPQSSDLAILEARVKGAKPEEINDLLLKAINAMTDPVARELRLFEFYRAQKQEDEAAKHLAAAEKAAPDDVRVMDTEFQYAVIQKQWDQAEAVAKRLTDINADQAKGLAYGFRLAMARGDMVKAAELAGEWTHNLPEFAQSWLALGQVRQAAGLYEQAIAQYRTALEKQEGNVDALRGMIECYYALNDIAGAKKTIDEALRGNPANSYFREQEARWDQTYGDPDAAVAPRLDACKLEPDVLERWTDLASAYIRASIADRARGKTDAADAALDNARKTLAQAMARPAFADRIEVYSYAAQVEAIANKFDDGLKIVNAFAQRPSVKNSPEPGLLLAGYYMSFNKPKEAEAALKDALAKSNNSVDLQLKVAQFYNQQGRADDALAVLDPKSADTRVQRQIIDTLIGARRFDEAQKLLKDRLAANPHDSVSMATLGSIYLNTGHATDAMDQFNDALKADPQNAVALYYRGTARTVQTPPALDEAVDDLRTARDLQPRNVDFRMGLADAYRRRHEWDNMTRELEAAQRLAPDRKQIRLMLVQAYESLSPPRWDDAQRVLDDSRNMPQWRNDPDWLVMTADMWARHSDAAKAADALKQALALAPEDPVVQRDYIGFLVGQKNYDDALSALDRAVAIPALAKLPWVYELRGLAEAGAGKKDLAKADFKTALGMVPKDDNEFANIIKNVAATIDIDSAIAFDQPRMDEGDFNARVLGASLFTAKRDYPSAVTIVEKLLAERDKLTVPQLISVLDAAGRLYMATNQPTKARVVYDELLKMDPDNLSALNNVAYLLTETLGQPQDALRYSKRAVELMALQNNVSADILDTHGWTLVQCGQLDSGIIYLQQAIDHQKGFIEGYYHLGDALLLKGDASQAAGKLEMALKFIQEAKDNKVPVDPRVEEKVNTALHDANAAMHVGSAG